MCKLVRAHGTNNTHDSTRKHGDNQTILYCCLLSLLGVISSRGVGEVQSWVKRNEETKCKPENRAFWQFLLNHRLANIISFLDVPEIINFRKTKYVKFIPEASDYFWVLKDRSVECDDILKEICLLISSHAFYLSCGLKGGFSFVHKYKVYLRPG